MGRYALQPHSRPESTPRDRLAYGVLGPRAHAGERSAWRRARWNVRVLSSALHNLGLVLRERGQLAQARELQQRAEAEAHKLENHALLLSIAIEQAWLALRETGAGSEDTAAAIEAARAMATGLGSMRPLLRINALALRCHCARGDQAGAEAQALVEALAAQPTDAELRAEVLSALFLANPEDAALAATFQSVMAELLEGVDTEVERASVSEALQARFSRS